MAIVEIWVTFKDFNRLNEWADSIGEPNPIKPARWWSERPAGGNAMKMLVDSDIVATWGPPVNSSSEDPSNLLLG